jgi:hypothetical protein
MIKTETEQQQQQLIPEPAIAVVAQQEEASAAAIPAQHVDIAMDMPALDRPSFLGGLVRKVVGLFQGDDGIETTDSPLSSALGAALAAMKLTGDPVTSVVESTTGRPVRYNKSKKRIIINTAHPSIKKLMPKKSCVLMLLASAVSEVNRELEQVTDAEELAILLDLLRANEG